MHVQALPSLTETKKSDVAISKPLKAKKVSFLLGIRTCYTTFVLITSTSAYFLLGLVSMQIAKDMERWAKGVNSAKAAQKQQLKALIELERTEVTIRDTTISQQPPQPLATEVKRSGISLSAALEVSYIACCAYITFVVIRVSTTKYTHI